MIDAKRSTKPSRKPAPPAASRRVSKARGRTEPKREGTRAAHDNAMRSEGRAAATRKKATRRAVSSQARGATRSPNSKLKSPPKGARKGPSPRKASAAQAESDLKSWLTRLYERSEEPMMKQGQSRHASRLERMAAAWNEKAPRTAQAARKVADAGRKLLERARRLERRMG
jgi:hypothetical protein